MYAITCVNNYSNTESVSQPEALMGMIEVKISHGILQHFIGLQSEQQMLKSKIIKICLDNWSNKN